MRKMTMISAIALSLFSQAFGEWIDRAEQITYEWLTHEGNSLYTDHIRHFHEIFAHAKIKNFLEFGLGFSTKYFLDSCNKVISVEFVTDGYGPEWMQQCLDLYREIPNWIPITYFSGYYKQATWAPYKYFGSEHVYKACAYQCSQHKDYSLIDNFYQLELSAFIDNLVKCHQIQCVFVDPGLYLRGDLVSLCFNKIPIIAAHDTYCRMSGEKDDVYGYSRIVTPENYEEISIKQGQGMTVWVKKDPAFQELIEALTTYAETIQE